MSSLRDVAERAGVSVATAWRVVHGADSVRPETRDRVERAMRDLLYVPQTRPESTGAIGLLLPEFANSYILRLAPGTTRNPSLRRTLTKVTSS